MNRNEKTGMIYVAIAGICWGIIGIFTRSLGTKGLDSIQITFLRNFCAAAELFLFLFIKEMCIRDRTLSRCSSLALRTTRWVQML